MSVVSGITLLMSGGEEDLGDDGDGRPVIMEEIDGWLERAGFRPLAQLDQHYAGGKHPQIFAFGGGYNYFPEDDFAEMVLALSWGCPERLLLIIHPDQGPPRIWRAPAPGEQDADIAGGVQVRSEAKSLTGITHLKERFEGEKE